MSETNMCIDGTEEPESREKLRAVLIQLGDPVRGRCALCKSVATLPFCLEFLDSKDNVVLWGDVCKECADKTTAERREVL